MEYEICKIESTLKPIHIFKTLAYICAAFTVIFLLYGIIDWFDDWVWISIVIFAALSVLFFLMPKGANVSTVLELTNKRIYYHVTTLKHEYTKNYPLNKITYYSFFKSIKRGKPYFVLNFACSTGSEKFVVNEKFYNEFVKAINDTIYVEK